MTEAMVRNKPGMASVKEMPVVQDGPPPPPPLRSLPLLLPPLARAFAPGVLIPFGAHRCLLPPPASGDGDVGAPLRQEGQVACSAHAHHIQSQEIQDQGPLVHEVQVQNHERRTDPQVEGRQATQCTPQVQGSKTKTSEACVGAFSLCKSYKEAQFLWLGNKDGQDGVWHEKQIDKY